MAFVSRATFGSCCVFLLIALAFAEDATITPILQKSFRSIAENVAVYKDCLKAELGPCATKRLCEVVGVTCVPKFLDSTFKDLVNLDDKSKGKECSAKASCDTDCVPCGSACVPAKAKDNKDLKVAEFCKPREVNTVISTDIEAGKTLYAACADLPTNCNSNNKCHEALTSKLCIPKTLETEFLTTAFISLFDLTESTKLALYTECLKSKTASKCVKCGDIFLPKGAEDSLNVCAVAPTTDATLTANQEKSFKLIFDKSTVFNTCVKLANDQCETTAGCHLSSQTCLPTYLKGDFSDLLNLDANSPVQTCGVKPVADCNTDCGKCGASCLPIKNKAGQNIKLSTVCVTRSNLDKILEHFAANQQSYLTCSKDASCADSTNCAKDSASNVCLPKFLKDNGLDSSFVSSFELTKSAKNQAYKACLDNKTPEDGSTCYDCGSVKLPTLATVDLTACKSKATTTTTTTTTAATTLSTTTASTTTSSSIPAAGGLTSLVVVILAAAGKAFF